MALVKKGWGSGGSVEGRRECVAALEVRLFFFPLPSHSPCLSDELTVAWDLLSWGWWQEAERAYQLWKARQVVDQQGTRAVVVREGRRAKRALVDFVVKGMKGDSFSELMEYMV
jgi:hypothetical protein